LGEQVAAARGGAGTVTVIEAAPGMGKTRLLEESAQIAARLSVAVGWGGGDRAHVAVHMAPVLEALFGGAAPLLDRSHLAASSAISSHDYWLLVELAELLEVRANREPLLICLDDMHWADAGSLAAVRRLTSQTVGSPVAWVVALRPGEAGVQSRELVNALVSAGATRLELAALERCAVAALVEDTVRGSPDEELLRSADAADGNPLLVLEFLEGLREEDALAVVHGRAGLRHAVLPQRLQELTERRLADLPSVAHHAASVAAVLGRSFRFQDLATMLSRPAAQTLSIVAELEQRDIVVARGSEYAFRHDLVHDAILRTLPPPAVRALERQAAGVLLEAGAAPVEIAVRMARSADVGDEVAIETLRGASRTLAPTDPRTAYELSRTALDLLRPGDAREGELVKEVVLFMHLGGDTDAARELADRAARTLPVPEQAELALTVATMTTAASVVRLAAGRQGLSLEGVPEGLRAALAAVVAFNLVCIGLASEARAADARAERMVRDTGSAKAAMVLALSRMLMVQMEGDYDELLRLARTSRVQGHAPEDQAHVRVAQLCEATALCGLDRLDEAIAVISEGVRSAHRDRQAWMLARWEIYGGRLLVHAGRLADARAMSEGLLQHEIVGLPECIALLALARVALHTDDRELARDCERIARATLEGVTHDHEMRRHLLLLLVLLAVARGDDQDLEQAFGQLEEVAEEAVLPLLGAENGDEPQVVRAALRVHALDIADQVIAEVQERADKNPAVASLRASAAHARGLRHRDVAELRSAVRDLSGAPRPLALASALEDLGVHADREEAIEVLGRALEVYAGCGASWDARRVRQRLRALGVRRRLVSGRGPEHGWAALTPTEKEVARLLGQGLTNKAVAEHLFVSPNTVGTHVRHVFGKLGVRSRAELAAHMVTDAAI
jgi:DNA-binding CsgD family transcriptional regulator